MNSTNDSNPQNDNNIVSLAAAAERRRLEAECQKPPREPFFNKGPLLALPPITKYMLLAFLIIHIITDVILTDPQQFWVFMHFGFIPGYYTDALTWNWGALTGPFTFTFLHGSWMHVILNGFMMMAFGTGVERSIGSKRMFIFFMLCNIAAALAQFAFSPHSLAPVIGASGGISGLFAAVLLMMHQSGQSNTNGRYGLLPFIALWIVISIAFGLIGGPDNSNIAWAAHIGGFLAGFVILKPIMKLK